MTAAATKSPSEALMTPTEAAEYLGVTRRWISRAVSERRFPVVKFGTSAQARIRFRRADLDKWVDDHTLESL